MANWIEVTVSLVDLLGDAVGYAGARISVARAAGDPSVQADVPHVEQLQHELIVLRTEMHDAGSSDVSPSALDHLVIAREWSAWIDNVNRRLGELHETSPLPEAMPVLDEVRQAARHYLSAGPHGPGKGRPPRPPRPPIS